MLYSLPAILNILALMLVFVFIYAILGMNFFGTLPIHDLGAHGGAR